MSPVRSKLKLGFLGVGWIGLNRMQAVLESGLAEVEAMADPSPEQAARVKELAPSVYVGSTLEDLLCRSLDGIVIATPSAQHASQARAALEHGVPVFCQKPLGRNVEEVSSVVRAAESADRLVAVDLSYRYTAAMRTIKALLETGELGPIYASRFVFHNAYGPDKPWYYDRAQAGGGCLMDLGIHLVDLALWLFPGARVEAVKGSLFAQGKRLTMPTQEVEDYASIHIELSNGLLVEVACSWRVSAGRDAVISAELFGPQGGAAFRNVDGSFYDFVAERYRGTQREFMAEPPDAWGGRAVVAWVEALTRSPRFDPGCRELVTVAEVLDRAAHS